MASRLALVAVTLRSTTVIAEPSPPPVRPPDRVALYTEASIGHASMRGAETHWDGTYQHRGADLALVRWALGAELRHHRLRARLGGVLDVTEGVYSVAPTLGIELFADGALDAGWRLGARVAVAWSDGNATPVAFDGTTGMAGLRIGRPPFSLGVDAAHVWRDDGHATGMIASVGVGGRPGKYLLGASAVGAVVAGLLVLSFAPRT
jgi:hypothetical protein